MAAEQVLFNAGSVADGYRAYLEPVIFAPWARRLVAYAHVRPGQQLLDVACGTGVVARVAAELLGPSGHVIASDISAGMLAHVPVGFPEASASLETLECSATALALPDNSVDVVVCQQGLPFIPDRPAAARELRRVLRPGGTAALAVWAAGERLDPFATYAEVLTAHGAAEPYPNAYDISRYCMTPDDVEAALAAAGFADIDVRVERLHLDWPDPHTAAQAISGTPFYPAVTALTDVTQQALFEALVERMSTPSGDAVRHVMTAVLARGTAR